MRLDGYPNGGTNADLADGRGAQMVFLGANFDYEFDNGWSISDKFLFNSGDVDTNALFSGTNPATLFDELYTNPTNLGGLRLPLNSATANFVGGGAVAADQSVIHQGWWFIHKELEHINNDFRLSKELFEGNTLTIGLYLAYYTMDDEWSLGNEMFMTNEPNARPITVSYVQGGQTFQRTDAQGFLDFGGFHIAQRGHAFNTHSICRIHGASTSGCWTPPCAMRIRTPPTACATGPTVDLDGNPLTLYNNAVAVCNGTLAITDYDEDFTSWTVGANYSFTDSMSAYVRVNRGGHFADFDNGIRGSTTGNTPRSRRSGTMRSGSSSRTTCSMQTSAPTTATSPAAVSADDDDRCTDRPAALLWLRVEGHQLHRLDQSGRQLPLPGGRQLSRRRVHGLRRLRPVHQRRDGQWLRADRRTAIAAPARSCATC